MAFRMYLAAGAVLALAMAQDRPASPPREFALKANSPRFHELISTEAKLEKVAGGFGFTEGALWDKSGFLYVSDEVQNRISRVYPDGRVEAFASIRDPDGNTFDSKGQLITCASAFRVVAAISPDGSYKILADRYEGKKFNSPNDIVLGPDGALYFTDPSVDLPKDEKQELLFQGIYRLAPDGALRLLNKDMEQPNGLAFSPDGKRLYVDDSRSHEIRVFDVSPNGDLSNGRLFGKQEGPPRSGASDGMKVDAKGNLFVTGPMGVWVWSPDGTHLGTIVMPESPANLAWGGPDYSTLYLTARTSVYRLATLTRGIPPMKFAQNYGAEQIEDHGVQIVRLTDDAAGVEVSIAPSIGNIAYEMKVQGKNILHFPYPDVGEFQKRPRLCGVPFLAPWADLLNEQAFWANGKRYAFDMGLGNVRGERPIHGLLTTSALWRVTDVRADAGAARVTSALEFWKYPDLMRQWPLAHEYAMTYSLTGGVLEVKTTVTNLSADPMPMAVGFHPFFRIPDIPRDEWTARYPARVHVIADEHNVPTGEMRANDVPNPLPLKGWKLDDGFTDLERDSEGRAHFSIEAGGKKVEVLFGREYPVATIWLPEPPPGQTREFICFEPLTTIISGINLQHEGKYSGLRMLPASGKWTGSFWIRASGI